MKKALVVLCGVLLLATVGCMTNEDREAAIRSEPTVTDWLPEETFETVEPVKKVDDLEMGRVIVKRTKDGAQLSAMVIPIRDILVGSTVKIAEVQYMHHFAAQMKFLVVR